MAKFYTKEYLQKKWNSGKMTAEEHRQMERIMEEEEREQQEEEDRIELARLDWEARQEPEEFPPFY